MFFVMIFFQKFFIFYALPILASSEEKKKRKKKREPSFGSLQLENNFTYDHWQALVEKMMRSRLSKLIPPLAPSYQVMDHFAHYFDYIYMTLVQRQNNSNGDQICSCQGLEVTVKGSRRKFGDIASVLYADCSKPDTNLHVLKFIIPYIKRKAVNFT